MQFVLHAGQVGVFFLNNFALAEQLQNIERLNFVRKKKRRRPRKARRWLHEGKVPCALNQFFFILCDGHFEVTQTLGNSEWGLVRDPTAIHPQFFDSLYVV